MHSRPVLGARPCTFISGDSALRIETQSFKDLLPKLHHKYGVGYVKLLPSEFFVNVYLADTLIGHMDQTPPDYIHNR